MSRSNDIPVISGEFPGVLKVQQGGTGEVSAAAVRSVHGLVNRDLLGEPGGVATMKVGLGTPMDPVDNDIILQGSTMVMKGDTVEILIVNFDSGKEYNITAEGGEAVLVGDKIFYTAGYEEGFFKLTVNGRVVHMSVVDTEPGLVRVYLPLNDELWKSNTVVFSCTPYLASGLKGEWERTEWEVFVDGGTENSIELFDVTQNETELSLNDVKRFDSISVKCRFINKEGSKSNWSNKYTIDVDKEDPGYYPIQKLTGTGSFGRSVAMNHDGSMAIVGASSDSSEGNYAEIYERSGSTYTLVQKLTGTGAFGRSVAMNHDGSMVIVGTQISTDGNYAEIYQRSGSTYTLVQKLTGTGNFGISVAMNHDGSMVIVGASNGRYAEIYQRSGSNYTLVQKLTGIGGFGLSVAMNHDGSMVIVGTYISTNGNYAEIYERSGSTYTLVKKLTGTGNFGYSVAMNHDGSMVIVGTYSDTSSGNYAEIYERSGSTYTLVKKLTGASWFGRSVAMNHDGSMVIVGTYSDTSSGNYAEIFS